MRRDFRPMTHPSAEGTRHSDVRQAQPASESLPSPRSVLLHALSLPLLGLVLALVGCSSVDLNGPGAVGDTTLPTAQQPAGSVVAGNLWSRKMDDKRADLERAIAGTGIQVTRTADNQLRLNVPADFSFAVGQSELKPSILPVLDEVSRNLEQDVRVTIVGHTDSSGSAATNDPLSMDRAEAVREYLVNHGVQRGRLLVEGRGARAPLASNATEAGRAANRRVEIYLSQPST